MELDAETVPDALRRYARINDAHTKDQLRVAKTVFAERFEGELHDAFQRRYGYDFMPDELGLNVLGFFALIETILVSEPDGA